MVVGGLKKQSKNKSYLMGGKFQEALIKEGQVNSMEIFATINIERGLFDIKDKKGKFIIESCFDFEDGELWRFIIRKDKNIDEELFQLDFY